MLSVEPYGMKRHGEYPSTEHPGLSVLSVEPYGMKPRTSSKNSSPKSMLSVLSVEPYGMKRINYNII